LCAATIDPRQRASPFYDHRELPILEGKPNPVPPPAIAMSVGRPPSRVRRDEPTGAGKTPVRCSYFINLKFYWIGR
jgi:hypothetical protein